MPTSGILDSPKFGLRGCLSLDADYEVSAALAEEIQNLVPDEQVAGYEAKFEYRIYGRSLRASVYPPRVVLFRARSRHLF